MKYIVIESYNYDWFDKREEIAYDNLYNKLKEILNTEQIYIIETILNEYTSELGEIYFNMGIKTGARLLQQLLNNENQDY